MPEYSALKKRVNRAKKLRLTPILIGRPEVYSGLRLKEVGATFDYLKTRLKRGFHHIVFIKNYPITNLFTNFI